jgi:hypothetical protein
MVEIGNGSIRRMGETFLLRTLPLWQGQGFAVAVLSSPNGMSLLAAGPPLPPVLGLGVADRLPLKVRNCVGATAGERLYVIPCGSRGNGRS